MHLANYALGLMGEAGEVGDYLKKVIFHKHKLSKEKVSEELGDVLWYMAVIADSCGLELEKIAEENIKKLRKRYPEGFDYKRSIERDKGESVGETSGD